MKNKIISAVLVWTIILISNGVENISAQAVSKESSKEITFLHNERVHSREIKSSLKKWDRSLTKVLDTPVDFDKINKESLKPLPKRKMSAKQKTFWVLFAIGMAALVFVAIKYYKECEIEDPDCLPGEICQCLKYKEESK